MKFGIPHKCYPLGKMGANRVTTVLLPICKLKQTLARISSDEGLTLETSCFESLRWPIHIINSVDKTKLSGNTPHRRSTTVSLETYPLHSFVENISQVLKKNAAKREKGCFSGYILFYIRACSLKPLKYPSIINLLSNILFTP